MSTSLFKTIGISITIDKLNYLISLGVICFIYLCELYCIYLDRNKQIPVQDATVIEYKKFYGKIQGYCIYKINKVITFLYNTQKNVLIKNTTPTHGNLSENNLSKYSLIRNKYSKKILNFIIRCGTICVYALILVLMLLKNVIFKLIFNKLFTMTVVTGACWYLYYNFKSAQITAFNTTQVPKLLVNIFGSSVYKDITFNDIDTSFDYSDPNLGDMNRTYKLKDYYINACHRPYIIGDDSSLPTTSAFQYIINAGARYLTFDIFEDEITVTKNTADVINTLSSEKSSSDISSLFIPNVRTCYVEPSKGIPFTDIIKALANTKPFSPNPNYPLILHLNFWTQENTSSSSTNRVKSGFTYALTYNIIYATLTNYFSSNLGLDGVHEFGYSGTRGNKTSIGNVPISLCQGKILIVTNNVTQYTGIDSTDLEYTTKYDTYLMNQDDRMKNLKPYIYGTVNMFLPSTYQYTNEKLSNTQVDPNTRLLHYTSDQLTEGIKGGPYATTLSDFINNNKTGMRIVVPDDCTAETQYIRRYNTFNPRVLDCLNNGCQVVLMNYQYVGQEIENYLQIFKKASFVLKPQILREVPAVSHAVRNQTTAVSLALKSTNYLGVIDTPIIY